MGQGVGTAANITVLIVEDEFLIAMHLVAVLEHAGYEVIGPAATVKDALKLLGHNRVHACILDVNLRGEHSIPVAHALRAQDVPFVLSSAYERATLEQHAVFIGVTNIGKPVPSEHLLSTLASLLKD